MQVDGLAVGKHPIVTRILKGAFHFRPPQPRYKSTWDVSQVITWLDSVKGDNTSIFDLSVKTTTLCVLTRPCRAAELASFKYNSLRFTPEEAFIAPLGNSLKEYFFPVFPGNPNICPVSILREYCNQTKESRPTYCLFLTSTKPHKPASSATIARWFKTALSRAGIDTLIFKAHSIRGASTSAAAEAGISILEILEAADWSSASTFEKFCYRPSFDVSVLNSASNVHS